MIAQDMIQEVRMRRHETIPEFADFLGIPKQVLAEWESGIISPPIWTALLIGRIVRDAETIDRLRGLNSAPK